MPSQTAFLPGGREVSARLLAAAGTVGAGI